MFLVMEYVEGQTLRCARTASSRWTILFYCPRSVLTLLSLLTRLRYSTATFKPENIMLTPAGSEILDFGIAHRWWVREDETTLETMESGKFAGTLPYVSPKFSRRRNRPPVLTSTRSA